MKLTHWILTVGFIIGVFTIPTSAADHVLTIEPLSSVDSKLSGGYGTLLTNEMTLHIEEHHGKRTLVHLSYADYYYGVLNGRGAAWDIMRRTGFQAIEEDSLSIDVSANISLPVFAFDTGVTIHAGYAW